MESLPVNKKVEMLVHRFISTLQKRIELRKKRMKNDEDDSEDSSDNFLSNKGSVGERPHRKIKPNDQVNLHAAKPSLENQINLGEESVKNEACNIGSADNLHDQLQTKVTNPRSQLGEPVKPGKPVTPSNRSFARPVRFPELACGAVAQGSTVPVFDRTPRPSRTSPDEINRRLGPLITKQSVPGLKVVLVRPRGQDHNKSLIRQEGDEEIPEEEAVCKFCFDVLKDKNIVLKIVCGCKNALAHEECASNWSRAKSNSNCESCEQEVQNFPVTLLRGFNSSERIDNRGKKMKWKLFSR